MTTMTGKPSNLPTDRHWCTVEAERLPEVIKAQGDRYWSNLTSRGLLALWRLMDQAYYGSDNVTGGWSESTAVKFGGESDELVLPRFNHVRSICQAILATATAEKPDHQAQSKDDGTASLIEAPIATGVVKNFWREHRMTELRKTAVETALLYSKGFVHLRWDIHAGKPVMQPAPMDPMQPPPQPDAEPPMAQAKGPNGAPLHEGDVVPAACLPISVIHELDSQRKTLDWCIVAHRADAWELCAQYPQEERALRDAIGRPRWPETVWAQDTSAEVPEAGDTKITVWCLYHRKTAAVPNGRYAIVAADRVLYDGPALVDDRVPVCLIMPMRRLGTGEGHSATWDLLNINELFDAGWSNIATGHDAFGNPIILSPNGSGFTSDNMGRGLTVEPYEPGPAGEMPSVLRVDPSPEGSFKYVEALESQMETISGVNSTARGNPDPNVKSGSFAALMDSKATHFQSSVQEATVQLDEDIPDLYLKLLKAVGGISRVAEIAGRSGARLKNVSASEIEQIERVTVEQINPTLSQPGVRWELTQSLIKAGIITTPEQALRIFTTGKYEPLFHAPEAQLDLIAGENDLLSDGQLPPVVYEQPPGPMAPPGSMPEPRTCAETDDHGMHIKEHAALLDLATRRDPAKVKAIQKHIADHTAVAGAMLPQVAALTGQTNPVGAAPAAPGEPGSPGGPKPGPGGLAKPAGPQGPAERAKPGGQPGGPGQPLMPENPATGERVPA